MGLLLSLGSKKRMHTDWGLCRDHVQLGQELDCIDFDTAAEVSGSKFVYLRRAAALLELALVNYAMQKVVSRGFVPIMTPDLVKESVLEKCGFQPRGTATQVCACPTDCLAPTPQPPEPRQSGLSAVQCNAERLTSFTLHLSKRGSSGAFSYRLMSVMTSSVRVCCVAA